MDYKKGDKVWVRLSGTDKDCWVEGTVTGTTAKRIRVFNEARGVEGLYAPHNVTPKEKTS